MRKQSKAIADLAIATMVIGSVAAIAGALGGELTTAGWTLFGLVVVLGLLFGLTLTWQKAPLWISVAIGIGIGLIGSYTFLLSR